MAYSYHQPNRRLYIAFCPLILYRILGKYRHEFLQLCISRICFCMVEIEILVHPVFTCLYFNDSTFSNLLKLKLVQISNLVKHQKNTSRTLAFFYCFVSLTHRACKNYKSFQCIGTNFNSTWDT